MAPGGGVDKIDVISLPWRLFRNRALLDRLA